ncbi:MAG: RNA polymerase sigma-70 factor [Bacteroidales bacterium]|jgi:RNA polymerase sigma-70 factor (ECF subfamily)|nr:RNA polymerase sigma-70 factor [Bacteroidales bacterium]
MLDELFIVRKIKEGNINVFETVFRTFYKPLYLYSLSITGNTANAEDIVQDLFYTLWKDRENINILYSLKSYLYKAVRNRSLQFIEKRKTHEHNKNQIAAGIIERTDLNPQSLLEYKELDECLQNCMKKLPQRRLHIFQLHRFDGKKYAEIADSLGLSIKTVEAEMTKTLKLLSKEIERYTK